MCNERMPSSHKHGDTSQTFKWTWVGIKVLPPRTADPLAQDNAGSAFHVSTFAYGPRHLKAHAHPSEVQGEKKWKEIWTHDPLKGYASTGLLYRLRLTDTRCRKKILFFWGGAWKLSDGFHSMYSITFWAKTFGQVPERKYSTKQCLSCSLKQGCTVYKCYKADISLLQCCRCILIGFCARNATASPFCQILQSMITFMLNSILLKHYFYL